MKGDNLSNYNLGKRFYSTYSGNSIYSGYRSVLLNSTNNPLILSSSRVGIRITSPPTNFIHAIKSYKGIPAPSTLRLQYLLSLGLYYKEAWFINHLIMKKRSFSTSLSCSGA